MPSAPKVRTPTTFFANKAKYLVTFGNRFAPSLRPQTPPCVNIPVIQAVVDVVGLRVADLEKSCFASSRYV